MQHLVNFPIELEPCEQEVIPTDTKLEVMYHKGFQVGDNVTIRLYDKLLHGRVEESKQDFGCYLLTLSIQESFVMRMVQQVIRIVRSTYTPEEWVVLFASDFDTK